MGQLIPNSDPEEEITKPRVAREHGQALHKVV
jgi:hypothetical protein